MEHGIPSEDTFRRLLARLDPHAFEQCFRKWVQTFSPSFPGEILHLDGQQLRHSFDTPCDQAALTLVRVWASQLPLVLATASVEAGSNEIPLAGSLLALFDLHECTVTADAAHCQTQTVEQIQEQGGDYVLIVKGNQPPLHQDMVALFPFLEEKAGRSADWQAVSSERQVSSPTQTNYGHGRQEKRSCRVLTFAPDDPDWQDFPQKWRGLRSLVRMERTRWEKGEERSEVSYYISRRSEGAKVLAGLIRTRWSIENRLHYVLDVGLEAEACRIRRDHSPVNLALVRSVALNLLRLAAGSGGIAARQRRAGWDNDYLLGIVKI